MEEYGTSVLRMCCAYLKEKTFAEDAAQETFVKAYQNLAKFRGDYQNEEVWLIRIAVNTCKDLLKSGWFKHAKRKG